MAEHGLDQTGMTSVHYLVDVQCFIIIMFRVRAGLFTEENIKL